MNLFDSLSSTILTGLILFLMVTAAYMVALPMGIAMTVTLLIFSAKK